MTFGSWLMQPSSSMWTRVALRVTTPFPLQTLLGSRSENTEDKSLTSTAARRSRHSGLIFGIVMSALLLHSCWEFKLSLPHAPNDQNRTNQAIKLISYCPVKLIAMITLSELEVEQLEVVLSPHRLLKWRHIVNKWVLKASFWVLSASTRCPTVCRHWKIDGEGCVTCGRNQVRRAFHGCQGRDPDSADRSRTWWDFNTHTQTKTKIKRHFDQLITKKCKTTLFRGKKKKMWKKIKGMRCWDILHQ